MNTSGGTQVYAMTVQRGREVFLTPNRIPDIANHRISLCLFLKPTPSSYQALKISIA